MPTARRRARTPASAVSLLAVVALLGSDARARTAAESTLPTVLHSECTPQFKVNGIIVSGCTTMDSLAVRAGNSPYCVLATPRNGTRLGLCNMESMRPRFGRAPDGTPVLCDNSTVVNQSIAIFGCFTTNRNGGQLVCNSGTRGLLPCLVASTPSSATPLTRNLAPSPRTDPDSDDADDEAESARVSTGAIVLSVGGVVLVTFAIFGAWFWFRRRKRNGDPEKTVTVERSKALPATSFLLKDEPNELRFLDNQAAREDVTPAKKMHRTSSQYGFGSNFSEVGTSVSIKPPAHKPIGKFVIASTYTPTLTDEIVIQPGDIVEVYQEFDDGWCSAINLSRGHARGVFPRHCIDDARGRLDD